MFYKSYKVELLMRIELATSSLPRKCSTPEPYEPTRLGQTEFYILPANNNKVISDKEEGGCASELVL